MEIAFEDVCYKDFTNLNFTIKSKTINGISGKFIDDVMLLLQGNEEYLGSIYFGNVVLKDNTRDDYKNLISIVPRDISKQVFLNTVEEYIAFNIKYRKLKVEDPRSTVINLLKQLGLDSTYLNKSISSLSISEQRLMGVVVSLLTNPKVLILDEIFSNFDLKFEKKLMRLFNYLIDNKNMTIILLSNDSEMLYRNTKHIILLNSEGSAVEGKSSKIYKDIELLNSLEIEVPDIVLFTHTVRERTDVKLGYFTDIRDLIKDVYKNV